LAQDSSKPPGIGSHPQCRMKLRPMLALAALLAVAPVAGAASDRLSPVTRVVELLQGLAKKVDLEQEQEEELYKKYNCWASSVISAKTASNEKAQSRADSLEAYVADLEAGRIELTTERVDLEKELAGLSEDIETAEALRAKQHEDYLAAKDELERATTALTSAVAILKDATSSSPAFLTLKGAKARGEAEAGKSLGFQARVEGADSLAEAVRVGQRVLSKGDALFLQRLLTGEVPVWDWKKLNRKADFKMKYKARSVKIQDTLSNLLATMKTSLSETEFKEKEAVKLHDKLMDAKKGQKTKAQTALEKMELEGGARGLTKSQANEEMDALRTQITNDKGYIKQATDALADKKAEFQARQATRQGELKAIDEALAVLHSDDARDLFKRSFSSQGYSLLQKGQRQRRSVAAAAAAATLRGALARMEGGGDKRLAAFVGRLAAGAGSHFDKVIAAIDSMISVLKGEETSDLTNKEQCEKDRAENTRAAALASRYIDEKSDTISRLLEEIASLEKEIKGKNEEVTVIKEQQKEALRVRESERTEWQSTDSDDADAAAAVGRAITVLEDFYQAAAGLLQQRRGVAMRQLPEITAGEAPPPPPSTWEEPYSGKQPESKGIISILTLVKEDIEKDRLTAKTAEEKAESLYKTFTDESNGEIKLLQDSITKLKGTVGDKEGEVTTAKQDRSGKKEELEAVLATLKAAAPGCDFVSVNFAARSRNRQLEIDGLQKAKAILQGAAFSFAADDTRELRPGDALLQSVHEHPSGKVLA